LERYGIGSSRRKAITGIKGALCFLVFISLFSISGVSLAGTAEVLPKGVWNIRMEYRHSFKVDERYNEDGDTEDAAIDYNTNLDSKIFPALGLVESFFGMPPGSGTVGDSVVSFEYQFDISESYVMYGVTDRLSVGIYIPYWWVQNSVDKRLDTTNATIGKNAPLNTLAPLQVPGTVPLTTDDVLDLLGQGLDINGDGTIDVPGYGYKRFKSFKDEELGDIELGLRYQYLKTDKWRLAFTGGVRFPTGEKDDADMLQDYAIGSGAYALLFRLNNDYTGVKNLVLNATFQYDLVLPDNEKLRIPLAVDRPITRDKETVDRDLGDIFRLEGSAIYTFSKGFSAGLTYWYEFKLKDDISGDKGYNYKSLEDETDQSEHIFIARLNYSTLPLYLAKKFPVPLDASILYRDRFAGKNNVLKSQYIGFDLGVYF
jgi:hypothetical protein